MVMRSKRKTGGKRKAAVPRPKRVANKLHTFKRSVYVPNFVATTGLGDTPFKLEATIADVPNSTDFTNLFDQYCITGISVKLIPRFNFVPSAGVNPPSQILSVLDYDGTGPTTLAALQQYQTVKVTRGTNIHQRFFKPAVLQMAYQSSTATAYVPKWKQFIDTANTAVPHYGLYGVIPNPNAVFEYDLEATYYISCKNVK